MDCEYEFEYAYDGGRGAVSGAHAAENWKFGRIASVLQPVKILFLCTFINPHYSKSFHTKAKRRQAAALQSHRRVALPATTAVAGHPWRSGSTWLAPAQSSIVIVARNRDPIFPPPPVDDYGRRLRNTISSGHSFLSPLANRADPTFRFVRNGVHTTLAFGCGYAALGLSVVQVLPQPRLDTDEH
jgi:hypothetical protein